MKTLYTYAASAILYHITSANNVVSILSKNAFYLKPSEGAGAEEALSKGSYYLSCAREMQSSYLRGNASNWSALIVLDGNKIATRYKVIPVDYWGQKMLRNEAEDRVIAPSASIPAKPYITEIRAIDPHNDVRDPHTVQNKILTTRKLLLLCKQAGIPITFYANAKELIQPYAKPIKLDLSKLKLSPEERKGSSYQDRLKLRHNGTLFRWITLYKLPVEKGVDEIIRLSKTTEYDSIYRAYSSLFSFDGYGQFNADLHNAKGQPEERERLVELINIMRANKWTAKDFFKHLQNKWRRR